MDNILIYRTSGLGDFVMTVPVFRYLKYGIKCSSIDLLTSISTKKLDQQQTEKYANDLPWLQLLDDGFFNEVFNVPGNFKDFFGLKKELKNKMYDAIIIPIEQGTPLFRAILKYAYVFMLYPDCSIYLCWSNTRILPAKLHFDLFGSRHHVDGLFDVCNKVGRDLGVKFIVDEFYRIDELASFGNPISGDYLCVAPGFIWSHKHWGNEKYILLLRAILRCWPSIKIILLGSEGDGKFLAKTFENSNVYDCTGTLDVRESAYIMRNSCVVVGNDGGAMHLADICSVPVVSIMPGIEKFGAVEPFNNKTNSVRSQVSCSPCYNLRSCPKSSLYCMDAITVDDVLEAISLHVDQPMHN